MWDTGFRDYTGGPPGEPCPRSARCGHLAGTAVESSKVHSIVLSSQLLQENREHGKTSEFCACGSVATLFSL